MPIFSSAVSGVCANQNFEGPEAAEDVHGHDQPENRNRQLALWRGQPGDVLNFLK